MSSNCRRVNVFLSGLLPQLSFLEEIHDASHHSDCKDRSSNENPSSSSAISKFADKMLGRHSRIRPAGSSCAYHQRGHGAMASIGKVAANAVVKATAIILVIRSRLEDTFRAGSMVSGSIGLDAHLNTLRYLLLHVVQGVGKAIQPWEHHLTVVHAVVHHGPKMLLQRSIRHPLRMG